MVEGLEDRRLLSTSGFYLGGPFLHQFFIDSIQVNGQTGDPANTPTFNISSSSAPVSLTGHIYNVTADTTVIPNDHSNPTAIADNTAGTQLGSGAIVTTGATPVNAVPSPVFNSFTINIPSLSAGQQTVDFMVGATVGGAPSTLPVSASESGSPPVLSGTYSISFTLNQVSAPTITTQPSNQAVTAGQTATFTAAASAMPAATVQWQVSTDNGVSFTDLSGQTSTTLSFTTAIGQNGQQFRAVFSNSQGTATTNAATLTVNAATAAPVITLQPLAQSVSVGQTATFTAAASGVPTPTVQWQVSINNGAFTNITGATSATLSFTPLATDTGNRYQAVFTNSVSSATTNAVNLTVSTVHAPPVANNDSESTAQNTPVTFNELSNDTASGATLDPTTVAIASMAGHGSVSVNATTGAITYTPTTGFVGSDSFTYTVKDSTGATSNAATVTLQVTAISVQGLLADFGSRVGDARYSATFDLNKDGVINIADYLLLVSPSAVGSSAPSSIPSAPPSAASVSAAALTTNNAKGVKNHAPKIVHVVAHHAVRPAVHHAAVVSRHNGRV